MKLKDTPELDAEGLRHFAFTTAIALIVLLALLIPWLFSFSLPIWPWAIGGGLVVWGFVAPKTLNPLYKLWMRFGLVMNRITTPIILGIVFYLVITPIAFIMRLTGRDTLSIKLNNDCKSYRVESTVPDYRKSMSKPF